jgi:hypothetical protein
MLNIGQAQDLLVSYNPTHTSSQGQAYPLEMLKEPVSGGDAYYDDFTAGLRKFAKARSLVLGGGASTAIIMDLAGRGGGADPMSGGDESDDELDADKPPSRVTGGSIIDFAAKKFLAAASGDPVSITSAIVDRPATGTSRFSADVRSLYAYAKRVGGGVSGLKGFVMIDKSGGTDGVCGCDGVADEHTNKDEDIAAAEDDYSEDDSAEIFGAMDETERELAATQSDREPASTILSAVVETSAQSF